MTAKLFCPKNLVLLVKELIILQGKYTLLVKNPAGEAKAESLLDVVGKPTPPKVVKEIEPKDITIPGKSELRLTCRITGFPMPKMKWLRDGNELKVRKGVLVSQDAQGNATLVIEKALVRTFLTHQAKAE